MSWSISYLGYRALSWHGAGQQLFAKGTGWWGFHIFGRGWTRRATAGLAHKRIKHSLWKWIRLHTPKTLVSELCRAGSGERDTLGVTVQSAWSQFGSKAPGQAITHCKLILCTHLLPGRGDVPTQREGDSIPGHVVYGPQGARNLHQALLALRLVLPELYSHRCSVP